jgi:hypothetical protein
MARAKIKLPKKSIIIGFAKGARASLMEAIWKTVMNTGIRRAVIGIGIHSVTHQTTIIRKMARRL